MLVSTYIHINLFKINREVLFIKINLNYNMKTISILLCILGALALILFLKERVKAHSSKALILKSLTSSIFVLLAISSLSNEIGLEKLAFCGLIIAGLVFCLLGDIWLDLKFIHLQDENLFMYAGFAMFAIGNLFYILAIILTFADFTQPLYIVFPIILGIILGIANGYNDSVLELNYGKFKKVVIAYAIVVYSFLFLLASFVILNNFTNMIVNFMFVGSLLFLVSDLILSKTLFGENYDKPSYIVLNHVFYYLAEFIIAVSLYLI